MFAGFTPTAIRLLTISATTSGIDIAPGAPEQLILMPTTSCALKKRAQLSRGSLSPVSVVMPRAIIACTVGTSTFSVASSMHFGRMNGDDAAGIRARHAGLGRGLNLVTIL